MSPMITVIGGGLAGCEAALKAAALGHGVRLLDMKPGRYSPAHTSPHLGELVCSNSLRSDDPASAVGILKREMELMGSAVMAAARAHAVPAGKALAVDREAFAAALDRAVSGHPAITRQEALVERLPRSGLTILATGPLTADPLAAHLRDLVGSESLAFYDAIAPIVTAESVEMDRAFWADRYGEGPGDYLNCPLTREEFAAFYQALTTAENVPLRDFEEPHFFEGCLPIEVMAGRGEKTLLFGPMKPVGLEDPVTGKRYRAVVQLRKEDAEGRLLNMVGFQTKLTHGSQDRVFRLIPALARAEFARLGSIHRNTFLDAPRVLDPGLALRAAPQVIVAGQLSGVEGYVESAAMGILAGVVAARRINGLATPPPPPTTALGGLCAHLANRETPVFQPSNINFGLMAPLEGGRLSKRERGQAHSARAMADITAWWRGLGYEPAPVGEAG